MANVNTKLNNTNNLHEHFATLLGEYGFGKPTVTEHLNKKRFAAQIFLSAVGGVMYWMSASGASERYLGYTQQYRYLHWLSFIFLWKIPELSAALTNFLFNAESYITLYDNFFEKRSDAWRKLTGIQHERMAWFSAFIAGIGATLPNWYISLNGGMGNDVSSTVSAVCSVPVNIDGSKALTDGFVSLDMTSRARVFCCENPQEQQEFEAYRKAQLILVERLQAQAQLIRMQQVKIPDVAPEQDVLDVFTDILTAQPVPAATVQTSLLPQQPAKPSKLLYPAVALVWMVGIYQNYGGVYDSYLAGKEVHWALAVFAAFANAVPSLGYTVKGVNRVVLPIMYGTRQKSIAEVELPKINFALTLGVCFFASLSCFTSDQMGYDAWNWWPNQGGNTGAFLSGLVSNLGSAFLYNLPQCILFVPRILEMFLSQCSNNADLRHGLSLGGKVERLAGTIGRMPVDQFRKLLQSDAMELPQDLFDAGLTSNEKSMVLTTAPASINRSSVSSIT